MTLVCAMYMIQGETSQYVENNKDSRVKKAYSLQRKAFRVRIPPEANQNNKTSLRPANLTTDVTTDARASEKTSLEQYAPA